MTMSYYSFYGLKGVGKKHSSFTQNKLTGSGDNALAFDVVGATAIRVASTYQSGTLVSVPKTKIVSMRANMRIHDTASTGSVAANCSISLHQRCGTVIQAGSDSAIKGGYHLFMGGNYAASTTTGLRFIYTGPNDNWAWHELFIANVYLNSWYKLRMDVIPNGSISDTIKVYQGTGQQDSEVWTLLLTKTLLSTDPGYQSYATDVNNGISAYSNGPTKAVFIDDYRIFVTDTV